jgi:hypothetical protein
METVMKVAVLWDVELCSLVDTDPDDEGSKLFCNIVYYLPDYMVQHPRRQPSSFCSGSF